MIICDKFSCNHCEEVFDFKNKLHDYIRNKKCQQSFIKSKSVNKINLTSLFIFKTIFNNFVTISTFAIKSIAFHKSNLSTLAFVEISSTSLLAYRFMFFLSPIYESYKKPYLTIVDLYMRYALLSIRNRKYQKADIFLCRKEHNVS